MNAVDVSGKLEVTSVAVGVAVVTQKAPETVTGTIVESAQVENENLGSQKGPVQKSNELLVGETRHSREIMASPLQQLPANLNTLDETELQSGDNSSLVTAMTEFAGRPLTPQEILELSPRAKLGRPGRKSVMTSQVAEQICTLISLGFSQRQAAAYLGIAPASITYACIQNPEFAADVRQAQDLQGMQPEMTIIAEAHKNWRAAAWYLNYKSKQPRRLTEEEKEALHQEQLADQRRATELEQQRLRNFSAEIHALRDEERKNRDRTPAPTMESVVKQLAEEDRARGKKVRGK